MSLNNIFHRYLTGRPDQVSGSFRTRCGIEAWIDRRGIPREPHEMEALANQDGRFLIADAEVWTTCAACKLKVTSTEKKILRLMLDYGHDWSIIIKSKRSLSAVLTSLIKKGLIRLDYLTYDGKLLAATYPKEATKPKGRTKRKTSR